MAESAMKNRKPGRPPKSPTELVRLNEEIVRKARAVASLRGISTTDYLGKTLAGPVDEDFRREMQRDAAKK